MTPKACAFVLHPDGSPAQGLCFEHPHAGWQVVKGTIEPAERPLDAARRELWEETGLIAQSGLLLGESDQIVEGEIWHFALLRVRAPVREAWRHSTTDGGGHVFACGWQPLAGPTPFEGRHARAWDWCRAALSA